MKKRKLGPPTTYEQKILDILLREMRRAHKDKRPIEIHIDPFTMGGGAYVSAYRCEDGHTYTVDACGRGP